MSPTPEEKKNKRGNQQLWRWTTRCAGLEAALSWRQSHGSRRSWQKTSKISLCATKSPVRQKTKENKQVPLIYKVRSSAQKNETEDYAQSIGSPVQQRLRSPGDSRSSLPWGITLDHLWDAEQESTSRWGRRGLHGERRRPQNTVNNADNQLVHQPDQQALRPPACCPRLVPTRCPAPAT